MSTEENLNAEVLAAEAETQDEIAQIMSEIEELQQEMNATAQVSPDAPSPSSPPASPTAQAPSPSPTVPPPPPIATPAASTTGMKPILASKPKPLTVVAPSPEVSPEIVEEAIPEPLLAEPLMSPEDLKDEELEQGILKEFSGDGDEPWLEETLANLKAEPVGSSILDEPMPNEPVAEPVSEISTTEKFESELSPEKNVVREMVQVKKESAHQNIQGSLSMTVKGKMTLQLNYEDGYQTVWVHFSSAGIEIEFADGTEFKVPAKKKAA